MKRVIVAFLVVMLLLTSCMNKIDNESFYVEKYVNLPVGSVFDPTAWLGNYELKADSIDRKYLDLVYGTQSAKQTLDIYLPNKGTGPFPVVFAFFGGAFSMGSSKSADIAPALVGVEKGYAVVAVNYRLSNEIKFPAQIYDAKQAIRWVVDHSAEYRIDPSRMAAWGKSSGGIIANLVGTTGGTNDLYDESLGYVDVSDKVLAVVSLTSVADVLTVDQNFKDSGVKIANLPVSSGLSPFNKWLGEGTELEKYAKAANPINYITEDDPAFFLQHGKLDEYTPYQQSILFAEALKEVVDSSKVRLEIWDDAAHVNIKFITNENIDKAYDFLDVYLK